jgi:hypothetical protein
MISINPNTASKTVSFPDPPRLVKQTLYEGYKANRRRRLANDRVPFECGYCSQTFRTSWSRDRHMAVVHGPDAA